MTYDDIRDVLKIVIMAVIGALARALLEWVETKKVPHEAGQVYRRDGGDEG